MDLNVEEYLTNHLTLIINKDLITDSYGNYCYLGYNIFNKIKTLSIKTLITSLYTKINIHTCKSNSVILLNPNSTLKNNIFMNDIIINDTFNFNINNINDYVQFINVLPSIKKHTPSSDYETSYYSNLFHLINESIEFDDNEIINIIKDNFNIPKSSKLLLSSKTLFNLILLSLLCSKYELHNFVNIFMNVMTIKYILINMKKQFIMFNEGYTIQELEMILLNYCNGKIINDSVVYDYNNNLCIITESFNTLKNIKPNNEILNYIISNINVLSCHSKINFFIDKIMNFQEYEYYYENIFNTFNYKLTKLEFNTFVNSLKIVKNVDEYLNVNCENCKNSFMCVNCINCEECKKCVDCEESYNLFKCKHCKKCENCYESSKCNDCYECNKCKKIYECTGCNNLFKCLKCVDCNDCEFCNACFNITNIKYSYKNELLFHTFTHYSNNIKSKFEYCNLQKYDYDHIIKKYKKYSNFIVDEYFNINCVNCINCYGCIECKNCKNMICCKKCIDCISCEECKKCNDCKYCLHCYNAIDKEYEEFN